MKPLALLLGASLGINTALLATLALKPELAPVALNEALGRSTASDATKAAAAAGESQPANAPSPRAPASPVGSGKAEWRVLDTPDLKLLVTRLRQAGYPGDVIRAIISARVEEQLTERVKTAFAKARPAELWKPRQFGPELVNELQALNRERGRLVRSLVPDELAASAEASAEQRRQFGNLPAAKIEALRRIQDDYTDMEGELRASFQNIILPEDREKLALLQREKRADLATVLSAEELAEYEMRASRVTRELRSAMTLMNASEAEFRAVFAAYQPHEDVLYPSDMAFTPDLTRRRQDVLTQVMADAKQALGPERFSEFERAADREFQQMRRLTVQGNLPAENAVQAYTLRAQIAAESARIAEAKDLSEDQKRASLKTLAQNARVQFTTLLGKDSYANGAQWLRAMESGAWVRFGPGGNVSLRPVGSSRTPRF